MRKFLLPILTIVILAGCSDTGIAKESSQLEEQKKYEWRLVTSWPKKLSWIGDGSRKNCFFGRRNE